jgi:hypothetical protein
LIATACARSNGCAACTGASSAIGPWRCALFFLAGDAHTATKCPMTLAWCISHPSRLVLVVAKGDFQPHESARLLRGIDRAKASPYRKIVDVTGLTSRFTADVLRSFASTVRHREEERHVGPIAIVAGSPQSYRQATKLAKQARGSRLIQVFQQQSEARCWLDGFYAHEHLRRVSEPGARND